MTRDDQDEIERLTSDFYRSVEQGERPEVADAGYYREVVLPLELRRLKSQTTPTRSSPPRLLVLLCGMSPQPLVLSYSFHQPERALVAVSSTEAGEKSGREVCSLLDLAPAEDFVVQLDERDTTAAYADLTRAIASEMARHGLPAGDVAIDITGGKKTMVAAAFLVASQLGTRITYVDGDYDKEARLPVPFTSYLRELRDPVAVYRLRDLSAAVSAFDAGRFGQAAELVENAARALADAGLSPPGGTLSELQADALRMRGVAAWSEALYSQALDLLLAAQVEPPKLLRALTSAWPEQKETKRLRRFATEQGGRALLQFAADRLRFALLTAAGDMRRAFLDAYSACEVAIDGLIMALLRERRLTCPNAKAREWRDVAREVSDEALLGSLAKGMAISEKLSIAESCRLGPPLEILMNECRSHRNDLVHKVAGVDRPTIEKLIGGAPCAAEQLLRNVSDALLLGHEGQGLVDEALSLEAIRSLRPHLPG